MKARAEDVAPADHKPKAEVGIEVASPSFELDKIKLELLELGEWRFS